MLKPLHYTPDNLYHPFSEGRGVSTHKEERDVIHYVVGPVLDIQSPLSQSDPKEMKTELHDSGGQRAARENGAKRSVRRGHHAHAQDQAGEAI
eukprot:6492412-Amphidinium_carterae.1